MKYKNNITVEKTLLIDPASIPAVQQAAADGKKIIFSNTHPPASTCIFDGGLDMRDDGRNVKKLQAQGKGWIYYNGRKYQYARAVAHD